MGKSRGWLLIASGERPAGAWEVNDNRREKRQGEEFEQMISRALRGKPK